MEGEDQKGLLIRAVEEWKHLSDEMKEVAFVF